MPLPPHVPPRGRRWRAALGAACVLLAVASVAAAGPPPPPAWQRGPRAAEVERPTLADPAKARRADLSDGAYGRAARTSDRYDLLHYELDLAIEPAQGTVAGSARLLLRSLVPDLREVVLDLDRALAVDSIQVRLRVEVTPRYQWATVAWARGADTLRVFLPTTRAVGDSADLRVIYRGTPPVKDGDQGLIFGRHHDGSADDPADSGPLVASNCEPAYSRTWRPCKDRPDDKSTARVALTVPAELIAVGNGTLEEERDNGDGTRTFVWSEQHPIAAYLLSVAVSDYVQFGSQCLTPMGTPVPLRHWVFPADAERAVADFAPLCDMIGFLEGTPAAPLLGPYPFAPEKYGHATFAWGGAMEHQTVTSIGYRLLTGLGAHEWLILHELAHQWLGDALTPRTWADIWLNEGFATYCEALWTERQDGRAAYLAYMDWARDGRDWEGAGPVYDPVPIFPGAVIYDKGAWILHMLRGRMGEEPFFALLRAWTTDPSRLHGTVTTDEFIALASSIAGEELTDFFRPYLDTDEIPRLDFQHELLADGTRLRVRLTQTQWTLFDNVYPIVAIGADDQRFEFDAHLRDRSQVFEWPVAAPDGAVVELDPENWVLWRPAIAPAPEPALFSVFPNPVDPRAEGDLTIGYNLPRAGRVALRIYDARGRRLAEGALDLPQARGVVPFWDGRDEGGRLVPAGVYWLEMEALGERSVKRLTVVR